MAAAGTMSAAALQDYHTKRHTSGVDMDDEALVHALRDVKSESRTNWMACTYDANNSQALRLLASGEGGFLELIESLTDTLVVYGCFMAVYEGQSKCVDAPSRPPSVACAALMFAWLVWCAGACLSRGSGRTSRR